MSKKKSFVRRVINDHAAMRAAYLRKFGRDEDGSIIVLTLLLLIIMLVLGGMAVDFMRFESRRVLLQSVSDRAVLAAAKLDQSLDSEEVVVDYFRKSGFESTIVGTPTVSELNGRRSVSVNAGLDVSTFYLRYIGIDQLRAPASSAAVEGVGSVEISLVLDISGSMETSFNVTPDTSSPAICADLIDNTASSKTQIQALREGAACFVRQVISEDTAGQVTMSLVPYSEHVNVGPAIFNQLNVSNSSGGSIDPIEVDATTGELTTTGGNQATCVEIPDAAYGTTDFDDSATYEQVESMQRNTWGRGGFTNNGIDVPSTRDWRQWDLDQPLCPDEVFERIIPVSDNEDALEDAILDLEPRGGTSIFLGLKWGVTLLDPSFADTLDDISNTGVLPGGAPLGAYTDNRPVAYPEDDPTVNSAKYIVLMTDGKNSDSSRVNSDVYRDYDNTALFNEYNIQFMKNCANGYMTAYNGASAEAIDICTDLKTNRDLDATFAYRSGENWRDFNNRIFSDTPKYTAEQGNTLLQNLCTAAKNRNMIIFTIALNADSDGETEMKNCASRVDSELYYFEATGNNLSGIFTAIANQITALRLNL